MPSLDLQRLLKPIGDGDSCGPDLELDNEFMKLVRQCTGKPAELDENGGVLRGAYEPNWPEAFDSIVAMLARTRHLRLGVLLTVALTQMEGFTGLAQGVSFVRSCVEQYWDDGLHPRLMPDFDNDPEFRLNELRLLGARRGSPPETYSLLDKVFGAPFVQAAQLGKLSLQDIAVAFGQERYPAGSERQPESKEFISKFFEQAELDKLEAVAKACQSVVDDVTALEAFVSQKAPGSPVDLAGLRKLSEQALGLLKDSLAKRGAPGAVGADGAAAAGGSAAFAGGAGGSAAGGGGGGGGGAGAGISGQVRSSAEASLALKMVIQYYDKHEPSSPVPYLIKAADRLVGKSFREVWTILGADAVGFFDKVVPPEDGSSSSS